MGKHGVRFGRVALRTANAERVARWYDEAFGAKRVFHAPRQGERQELMFLESTKVNTSRFSPTANHEWINPPTPSATSTSA